WARRCCPASRSTSTAPAPPSCSACRASGRRCPNASSRHASKGRSLLSRNCAASGASGPRPWSASGPTSKWAPPRKDRHDHRPPAQEPLMAATFELVSKFQPAGDQPQAIAKIVEGFHEGRLQQVLLGATGTGKTF